MYVCIYVSPLPSPTFSAPVFSAGAPLRTSRDVTGISNSRLGIDVGDVSVPADPGIGRGEGVLSSSHPVTYARCMFMTVVGTAET